MSDPSKIYKKHQRFETAGNTSPRGNVTMGAWIEATAKASGSTTGPHSARAAFLPDVGQRIHLVFRRAMRHWTEDEGGIKRLDDPYAAVEVRDKGDFKVAGQLMKSWWKR